MRIRSNVFRNHSLDNDTRLTLVAAFGYIYTVLPVQTAAATFEQIHLYSDRNLLDTQIEFIRYKVKTTGYKFYTCQ
jgi:hypothetical protein